MDAIKKKMQAMKLEKENALEKSDELEQKLQEQKETNEKVRNFIHLFINYMVINNSQQYVSIDINSVYYFFVMFQISLSRCVKLNQL